MHRKGETNTHQLPTAKFSFKSPKQKKISFGSNMFLSTSTLHFISCSSEQQTNVRNYKWTALCCQGCWNFQVAKKVGDIEICTMKISELWQTYY